MFKEGRQSFHVEINVLKILQTPKSHIICISKLLIRFLMLLSETSTIKSMSLLENISNLHRDKGREDRK